MTFLTLKIKETYLGTTCTSPKLWNSGTGGCEPGAIIPRWLKSLGYTKRPDLGRKIKSEIRLISAFHMSHSLENIKLKILNKGISETEEEIFSLDGHCPSLGPFFCHPQWPAPDLSKLQVAMMLFHSITSCKFYQLFPRNLDTLD